MNVNKIEDKKIISKGKYSKCYELESGSVLKIFNKPQSLTEIDKFRYMLKYKNENFLFPIDFVYDDKKFYGYIVKKAIGNPIKDVFSSSNLEELASHSAVLEKNISKISKGRILVDNFHEGNIMYNGKKFEVIDTDFYQAPVPFSPKEIKSDNLTHYRFIISRLLNENLKYSEDTKYVIEQVRKYVCKNLLPSDMIMLIKEDIEDYCKEEINTLDDFQKIIRR